MDSLLVAAGVSALAAVGSEHYIVLAITLSLLMGLIQVLFGVMRLGFLVNFLSKPVISGFTSAAALIIGMNQLKHVIGVGLDRGNSIFSIIYEAVLRVDEINWIAVAIALAGILLIKYTKKVNRSIPGALIVVIFGILVVKYGELYKMGVKVVGDIPDGLPSFTMPELSVGTITELMPIALTLALIAFMEAISVAKAIQAKHKGEYTLDNNQEMIGIGMGNIVGSFFGCYPTTGGFSRSAVNDQAGAKTNLSAIVSAALIGLTLLFLTSVFYYLPLSVLGAIILVAVFGLIDWKYPAFLWKTNKSDLVMLVITFVVTLIFGIKEGIGAGVLVSLIMLIYRTTNPHIAILGRVPGTEDYRNVKRFDDLEIRSDVSIIRHDGQLYFANIEKFIDSVKKEVEDKSAGLKLIVLHFATVSTIDATALQGLKELIQEINENHVEVYFSGVIGPVRDYLHQAGFIDEVGKDHFFIDINQAIDYLDNGAQQRNKQMMKRALQTNVFRELEI